MNHPVLDAVFMTVVVLIWSMLAYQFVLCFLGAIYRYRALRERSRLARSTIDLPRISILIPAHNEAVVLDQTLAAMARLQYPNDRLEVIVINDASTDSTGAIAENWAARNPRFRILHIDAAHRAGGKSAALNRGQEEARYEVIGVYDADNTPEPEALLHLARQLASDPRLGAVVGMFRTVNKTRNWLTRMISIEGIAFQWIVQAGRWMLMRVNTLPGTNLLIRKKLLTQLGGWDTSALTEDQELSIQIYEAGYQIKFVPYAVTWEQEPERFSTWFRQRTRWARGNNYTILKHAPRLFHIRPKRLGFELLYALSLYYTFFLAILLSDLLFLGGILGIFHSNLPGAYHEVWFLAFGLYMLEVIVALAFEDEDSPMTVMLTALSYFTYCQLWILVVCKAFYDDFVLRKAKVWAKTERFAPDIRPVTVHAVLTGEMAEMEPVMAPVKELDP
jgi:hypothetical protein